MVTALPTRIDGFRWSDGLLAEGSLLLANPPSSRAPARFRRLSRRPYQECDRRRPVVLGDGQEILVRAAVRPYKQNGFVRNAHLLTLVLSPLNTDTIDVYRGEFGLQRVKPTILIESFFLVGLDERCPAQSLGAPALARQLISVPRPRTDRRHQRRRWLRPTPV